MLSPQVYLSALKEHGYVDEPTSQKLILEALQSGKEIEDIVLSYNLAPKEVLLDAKARCLNVPSVIIDRTAINPEAVNKLPKNIAIRHSILPFKIEENQKILHVASPDPLNLTLQNFLEQKTSYHIKFHLAYKQDIDKTITIAYSQSFAPEVSQALEENKVNKATQQSEKPKGSESVEDSPVTKIVDTILEYASQSRASDIHIEPQDSQTRVRYRIDGILHEKLVLPLSIHESLISRLKIMAGLKLDERRIPQDGRFAMNTKGPEVDIRVSTLPIVAGEKVVMRLLRKSGGLPTLPELGLQNINLKLVQQAIDHPYGIVLVTGPTGSGKTTTLYSILTILNKPTTNIMTLEDPVEYQINGINQVQINTQAGLTFASGLRAFLRQDPNIILVGEIRDTETTQLSIQAALTGHLVFSTLHTNDSATAIPRLIDLGAEPFLISSVITACIAQRIARKVCPNCKIQYEPTPEVKDEIINGLFMGQRPDIDKMTLVKGTGCEQCDHSGYYGRIGIYEVLTMSSAISTLVMKHATADDIKKQAMSEGMINMRQDGFMKALAGYTTIEEVMRLTQV